MKHNNVPTPSPAREQTPARPERLAYAPPRLERLGGWSALTLQQSIGVGPGNW